MSQKTKAQTRPIQPCSKMLGLLPGEFHAANVRCTRGKLTSSASFLPLPPFPHILCPLIPAAHAGHAAWQVGPSPVHLHSLQIDKHCLHPAADAFSARFVFTCPCSTCWACCLASSAAGSLCSLRTGTWTCGGDKQLWRTSSWRSSSATSCQRCEDNFIVLHDKSFAFVKLCYL